MKLTTNPSILINTIVPENFHTYWNNVLTPLMKTEYITGEKSSELPELKEKFYGCVVLRDNIGEAVWYIYTAILLSFVVSYNIAQRGCKKDPQAIADDIQNYQEAVDNDAQKKDDTIYT